MLRKNGTPADLQKHWIGHSSLTTTACYSHTDQELDYRRNAARRVCPELLLDPTRVVGPSGSQGERDRKAYRLKGINGPTSTIERATYLRRNQTLNRTN